MPLCPSSSGVVTGELKSRADDDDNDDVSTNLHELQYRWQLFFYNFCTFCFYATTRRAVGVTGRQLRQAGAPYDVSCVDLVTFRCVGVFVVSNLFILLCTRIANDICRKRVC